MSFFLKALLAALVGTVLGLWATAAAVNHGFLFGAVSVGPWVAFPTVGSPAIDPYARAVLARTAYVPVGADEGLSFAAVRDGDRRPLTGACDYVLESGELPARFWTLGLFDREGRPVANAADRHVLTSQSVVRVDRRITIAVAATVQPGNWLPSSAGEPFTLVLSLYEANGGTAVNAAADVVLPTVRRGSCRS